MARRDDGWTDLGECKWGRTPSASRLRDELEQKASRYPNKRGDSLGRIAFVRRRPSGSASPSGLRVLDLQALYEIAGR